MKVSGIANLDIQGYQSIFKTLDLDATLIVILSTEI